ncbi:MAG: CDP-alcohol phosphatidyltransferase family protein [Patescibacteria group bacterium]
MTLPSFFDTHYYPAEKVFWTDRVIERTVLRVLPRFVTPNHITLFRLLATPLTIYLLAEERYSFGIPLFLFVAFTDALDGALARTRNMITDWGRMFDPAADKVLVISAIVLLIIKTLPLGLALLMIALELFVMAAAVVWRNRGGVISANVWGKIKMILQVAGIFLLLLSTWLSLPLYDGAALVLGTSVYFSIASIVNKGI